MCAHVRQVAVAVREEVAPTQPVGHAAPVEVEDLPLVRQPEGEVLVHADAVAELPLHPGVQLVAEPERHGEQDHRIRQRVTMNRKDHGAHKEFRLLRGSKVRSQLW